MIDSGESVKLIESRLLLDLLGSMLSMELFRSVVASFLLTFWRSCQFVTLLDLGSVSFDSL